MANSQHPSPSPPFDADKHHDSDGPVSDVENIASDRQTSDNTTSYDDDESAGESDREGKSDADSDSKQASTSHESSAQIPSGSSTVTVGQMQSAAGVPDAPSAGDWQAIWSPAHNAYYFYNAKTQETTWVNPLQSQTQPQGQNTAGPSTSPADTEVAAATPSGSGSTAPPNSLQSLYDLQAAAAAHGIDPALAYLDPSLAAGSSSAPSQFTYTAKFNARTGAFAKPDARDPTHLSEYERAKRMSEFYFDVGQWEQDVEARNLQEAQEEVEGRKRKRPTKKDLVCLLLMIAIFKEGVRAHAFLSRNGLKNRNG